MLGSPSVQESPEAHTVSEWQSLIQIQALLKAGTALYPARPLCCFLPGLNISEAQKSFPFVNIYIDPEQQFFLLQ